MLFAWKYFIAFNNLIFRLSSDLWDNQPQELNDGPVCR